MFQEWLKQNLNPQERRDLARFGATAGFPGLTYYTETTELYKTYHEEVWSLVADEAESMGYDNPLAFMATWNGADNVWNDTQFFNLMVWFAAETYCRQEFADE